MNSKYILAIDQGTTSSRAIIFDQQLRIVSQAQQEFTQYFPKSGWVEHDAEEIWESVKTVMEKALKKARLKPENIAAIGITNQRETTVMWDKKTSEPVHNAIVWQSRQSDEICKSWIEKKYQTIVRKKTGLLIDAYFSASKIAWLLKNVKGLKAKARKGDVLFGTIDTWLLWKLTDGKVHATDASNASRTMLCNINTCEWDQELLKMFDIPAAILPEIKDSSGVFGTCENTIFKGIPISGIAGDQQAALFGQCCFDKGMAKNTYGTGCFMLMNTGNKVVESEKGLLSTIAWKIDNKLTYALEGSVFVAGSAIQWLRDNLGILKNSSDSEKMALALPANEGVYFVPAFVGLGSPYWESDARGIITGLTRGSTKNHIVRAATEAMAYQTYDVFDLMQNESGLKLKTLRIDGGASVNNFLAQFQADILNTTVERPVINETTALGAAMLAGLGVNYWHSQEELLSSWAIDQTFAAKMDKKTVKKNLQGWKLAIEATLKLV